MNIQTIDNINVAETAPKNAVCAVTVFDSGETSADAPQALRDAVEKSKFGGKLLELTALSFIEDGVLRQAFAVGGGKREKFGLRQMQLCTAALLRFAKKHKASEIALFAPNAKLPETLSNLVSSAIYGIYENAFYQDTKGEKNIVKSLTVVGADIKNSTEVIEKARIIAEATNWTRALVDEPGNKLPPSEFAERAKKALKQVGVKLEILEKDEIERRGMGGLFAVGKGSAEPPVMMFAEYVPENAADQEVVAFVGKGMTFDTGGICIKERLGMEEMKSDMAGGATALGALLAIAQLKLNKRVMVIVPSAENMPNGNAVKPSDVIETLAGKTIEVIDTDAEGRLILCDGIAFAKEKGATKIVDLATLTGSIIIALGDNFTGLFSNDEDLKNDVTAASKRAGEQVWQMPCGDEYIKNITSDVADYKNYGGRPDASSAALLLSKFADETPWCHLDIAGTSWFDVERPFAPAGASGSGVKTLIELVK